MIINNDLIIRIISDKYLANTHTKILEKSFLFISILCYFLYYVIYRNEIDRDLFSRKKTSVLISKKDAVHNSMQMREESLA